MSRWGRLHKKGDRQAKADKIKIRKEKGGKQMQGWIKLHRQIQDSWIWEKKPFSEGQAWIDLLLMANHAERKVPIGNELIVLQPGTIITSERKLMERWGWSKTKVRAFIGILEQDKMVSKRTNHKQTVLIVEKYTIYQENETSQKPLKDQSKTSQKPHNKNVKNVKNVKNDNNNNNNNNNNNIYISFKPPTVEEVQAYCTERNNGVNAETFVNFYESKGWMVGKNRMKDWKAAVRTWEKNNRSIEPKKTNWEEWLNDKE